MKSISGYVLVKETNAGVPNLVVAAYDAEKHNEPQPDQPAAALSMRQLGRRLGSVLTDADGRFSLCTADLEFQGNESRPDLVLVVFAPEDVNSLEAPVPAVPEQRVLYRSAVPRLDAGAEEAFVIRLLRAQILRFQIPTSTLQRQGGVDSSRLAGAIESTWDLRDSLQARLAPRLQAEHDAAQKRRAAAQRHVASLSAIPLYLRDGAQEKSVLRNNDLLVNGKSELAGKLESLQKHSLTAGLDALDKSENKPTLRVQLTAEELTEVGLEMNADGEVVGDVDFDALAAKARALSNGADLVKVRGLNNPTADELEHRYLSNDPGGHDTTPIE